MSGMENDNYLKYLAGNLLNLEVNTIVKNNTTGQKLPSNWRVVLREIAKMYREEMLTYGIYQKATGQAPDKLSGRYGLREKLLFRWEYGGEFSFNELRLHAKAGIRCLSAAAEQQKEARKKAVLESRIRMLERVDAQSTNILGMFKKRRKEFGVPETEGDRSVGMFAGWDTTGVDNDYEPFPSQTASFAWNNDVNISDINQLPDLDLSPEEITQIRKAWELGTEQVLLQTIIQIDGDVTCYLSTSFIELPAELRSLTLELHNDSIRTSTQFWSNLVQTVSSLAGKAFTKIFARNKA